MEVITFGQAMIVIGTIILSMIIDKQDEKRRFKFKDLE